MFLEYTIIAYRQYGKWSCTLPFKTLKSAQNHSDLYLRDPNKDYIVDITFITIYLPE